VTAAQRLAPGSPTHHRPTGAPSSSTVSVIVPCYNYAAVLGDCLDSVLRQEGPQIRVLVINDASPDHTAETAELWAQRDPRVEVRHHDTNLGNIATYNEGLAWAADGDYTVLLSADDMLTPGSLARAAQLLDAHPDVGFVYGGCIYFTHAASRPTARTSARSWTIWDGEDWIRVRCRDGHNCISSPEVMVRSAVQQRIGGYRSDLPMAGDLEMWLRFAAHGKVGYVRGADQAYYRIHATSMLRSRADLVTYDLQQRRDTFDALFDTCGDQLAGASRLRGLARQSLAREALWKACRAYDRGRVDTTPVDELVTFAQESWPAASALPEARGLRRRQRVGPRAMPYLQPLVWKAITRKLANLWWWQSVRRFGA
jgi:GT2 family glycosyltransferase